LVTISVLYVEGVIMGRSQAGITMDKPKVVIVGFGKFGQTLADVLGVEDECTVCGVDVDTKNDPRQVKNPWEAIQGAAVIFLVVPSACFSKGLEHLKGLRSNVILVACSKGFDGITGKLPFEVLKGRFPKNPVVVLSGPSLADELRQGLPTRVTLASSNTAAITFLQGLFSKTIIFPKAAHDMIGVSLLGILKNVYTLALGASDGKELGNDFKSILVQQAACEITAIVKINRGHEKTFLRIPRSETPIMSCAALGKMIVLENNP